MRHVPLPPAITIGNQSINQAFWIKTIAFTFNNRRHCHMAEIKRSVSRTIYKLRHLRTVISFHVLRSVYMANIKSRLRYGIRIWGSSRDVSKTLLCHKSPIWAMVGVSHTPYFRTLFIDFRLLTVISLYIFESSISYVPQIIHRLRLNNNPIHNYNMFEKLGYMGLS